jgi:uncharacterized protein (DUF924 family)
MTTIVTPHDILGFWIQAGSEKWFAKDNAFDAECRKRFLSAYRLARDGQLDSWAETAEGAIALILLLDQMPRNMFRGTPEAFGTDPKALTITRQAIAKDFDQQIDLPLRGFFYLPFMHAEDLEAQKESLRLNKNLGDEESLKFARHHHDIIARFGRFPHRNTILNRMTTMQEAAFLQHDDFRG